MRSITLATNATLSTASAFATPFLRVDLKDAVARAEVRELGHFAGIPAGLGFNQTHPWKGKLFRAECPCWLTSTLTVGEKSLRNSVTVQLLRQLAARVVFGVSDSRVKRNPEHQQSKTFHYEVNL